MNFYLPPRREADDGMGMLAGTQFTMPSSHEKRARPSPNSRTQYAVISLRAPPSRHVAITAEDGSRLDARLSDSIDATTRSLSSGEDMRA